MLDEAENKSQLRWSRSGRGISHSGTETKWHSNEMRNLMQFHPFLNATQDGFARSLREMPDNLFDGVRLSGADLWIHIRRKVINDCRESRVLKLTVRLMMS